MIRAIIAEAMTLAALTMFIACIAVWSAIYNLPV